MPSAVFLAAHTSPGLSWMPWSHRQKLWCSAVKVSAKTEEMGKGTNNRPNAPPCETKSIPKLHEPNVVDGGGDVKDRCC